MDFTNIIISLLSKKGIKFSSLTPILESNQNRVFAVDDMYILKWKDSDSLLSREYTAIEFVRQYVTKVPELIFYETNEYGEFLLMKRLPGRPLDTEWKEWWWNKCTEVVKEIIQTLKNIHNTPIPKTSFREVWFKKEYENSSYSDLLKNVFLDGMEIVRKNPFLESEELRKIQNLFLENYKAFSTSTPSFVHHDFWYKNILVDKNGLIGIIDFELFGYVPKQVELFLFLYSRQTAKNYIDNGAEDYTELEFLDSLLIEMDTEYPELKNAFNSKEFLVYSLCKYMSLLSRWQESWYSHEESKKFFDTFVKIIPKNTQI